MTDFFKPEDFRIYCVRDGVTPSKVFEAYAQQAAEDANALLRERGVEVFGLPRKGIWHQEHGVVIETHRALLVCIEPLEREGGEK